MSNRTIFFCFSSQHLQATPTPREFVQYLLDLYPVSNNGRRFDAHFRPQWISGYFCEAHYDYIGRLETFQKDTENIRKALKIPKVDKQNLKYLKTKKKLKKTLIFGSISSLEHFQREGKIECNEQSYPGK